MTTTPPSAKRGFHIGVPIAELDKAITGSTDLSGDKKNRIAHVRVSDIADLAVKYEIGRKLGQGSFGTVHLVQEKSTATEFACKSLKKKAGSQNTYEQLQREVAILKLVRHPHIIKLHEVYETPKKIFLVMEYCGGGELDEAIRLSNCSENDARIIIQRISDSIGYLHSHGIVHRDIKPQNILLSTANPNDPLNVKLSDFGLATWVNNCTMMENVVGTPLYMAPEIIQNLPYSAQCDIWSIGVMSYLLLFRFHSEVEQMLQQMVVNGKIEYPEKLWSSVASSARGLCDSMLRIDPAKRISAKEILMHPWIQGSDANAASTYGVGQPNSTVLDLMRSYNTQVRLKRILLFVRCAIRFNEPIRRRYHRQTIGYYNSAVSSASTVALSSTPTLPPYAVIANSLSTGPPSVCLPTPPHTTAPKKSQTTARASSIALQNKPSQPGSRAAQAKTNGSFTAIRASGYPQTRTSSATMLPLAQSIRSLTQIHNELEPQDNTSGRSSSSLASEEVSGTRNPSTTNTHTRGYRRSADAQDQSIASDILRGFNMLTQQAQPTQLLSQRSRVSAQGLSMQRNGGRTRSLDMAPQSFPQQTASAVSNAPVGNQQHQQDAISDTSAKDKQGRMGEASISKFAQHEAEVTSLKKPMAGSTASKTKLTTAATHLAGTDALGSNGTLKPSQLRRTSFSSGNPPPSRDSNGRILPDLPVPPSVNVPPATTAKHFR